MVDSDSLLINAEPHIAALRSVHDSSLSNPAVYRLYSITEAFSEALFAIELISSGSDAQLRVLLNRRPWILTDTYIAGASLFLPTTPCHAITTSSRHLRRIAAAQGYGYPLWLPGPLENLPNEYIRDGTQIGDLGYLADDGGGLSTSSMWARMPAILSICTGLLPTSYLCREFMNPLIRNCAHHRHQKNARLEAFSKEKKSIGGDISAEAPCGFFYTLKSSLSD